MKSSSSMYPGQVYVAAVLLNLSLPPPQARHRGMLPKSFPSAHFETNSPLLPVLAWPLSAKLETQYLRYFSVGLQSFFQTLENTNRRAFLATEYNLQLVGTSF